MRSNLAFVLALTALTGCSVNLDVLTPVPRTEPEDAEPPPAAAGTDIVAAFTDTCAVVRGALYCWGTAPDGQIHALPTLVTSAGARTFRRVSSGLRAHCAEQSNGSVWCWGVGTDGQLGQGDGITRNLPTGVTLPGPVTRVRGRFGSFSARLESGALFSWGDNAEGQMGQPDSTLFPGTDALLPVEMKDPSGFLDADQGQGHGCAIRNPGQLLCWGRNTTAELGLGPNTPGQIHTPTPVGDSQDWLTVSTGQDLTCGLRDPGALYCFGDNTSGQLGVGDRTVHDVPTRAGDADDWIALDLDTFHACGIRRPGTLWCWGRNAEGQLGTGDITDHDSPVKIGELSDWVQVTAGRFHTCGRRADDSLWCTGENEDGRLGTGDLNRRNVMTPVLLPAG